MFDAKFLKSLLALTLLVQSSVASPVDTASSLAARDDTIRCSNAPHVAPGVLVNPSDIVDSPNLWPSGSSASGQRFLWCTPGTRTYTFFEFGKVEPSPATYGYFSVKDSLNMGKAQVKLSLAKNGDVHMDETKDDWHFSFTDTVTNTWLSMHNNGGRLTFGMMGAALTGLLEVVEKFNSANMPMTFQVYDGDWGITGSGFLGLVPSRDKVSTWHSSTCLISYVPPNLQPCSDAP